MSEGSSNEDPDRFCPLPQPIGGRGQGWKLVFFLNRLSMSQSKESELINDSHRVDSTPILTRILRSKALSIPVREKSLVSPGQRSLKMIPLRIDSCWSQPFKGFVKGNTS